MTGKLPAVLASIEPKLSGVVLRRHESAGTFPARLADRVPVITQAKDTLIGKPGRFQRPDNLRGYLVNRRTRRGLRLLLPKPLGKHFRSQLLAYAFSERVQLPPLAFSQLCFVTFDRNYSRWFEKMRREINTPGPRAPLPLASHYRGLNPSGSFQNRALPRAAAPPIVAAEVILPISAEVKVPSC